MRALALLLALFLALLAALPVQGQKYEVTEQEAGWTTSVLPDPEKGETLPPEPPPESGKPDPLVAILALAADELAMAHTLLERYMDDPGFEDRLQGAQLVLIEERGDEPATLVAAGVVKAMGQEGKPIRYSNVRVVWPGLNNCDEIITGIVPGERNWIRPERCARLPSIRLVGQVMMAPRPTRDAPEFAGPRPWRPDIGGRVDFGDQNWRAGLEVAFGFQAQTRQLDGFHTSIEPDRKALAIGPVAGGRIEIRTWEFESGLGARVRVLCDPHVELLLHGAAGPAHGRWRLAVRVAGSPAWPSLVVGGGLELKKTVWRGHLAPQPLPTAI